MGQRGSLIGEINFYESFKLSIINILDNRCESIQYKTL